MSSFGLISTCGPYVAYRDGTPRSHEDGQDGVRRTLENLAPWRVKKAKEMMISLMAQGCSIEQVARACAISRSHFSRAFKNATGLAPHDWFRQEQIRKAQVLLRMREISICCVAQECGFSDQSYFARVFKQFTGFSPRRWQLQHWAQATQGFNDAFNE
ncbi:helix-turn-helix transcriptional regulator [Pseudomonas sp. NPDC090202]|uniref:helix-turn-helix transcriptional regulator n=1 Tax=unclassified Pseudomonas TaxID=196821 RepID=UPI0037FFCAD3